MKKIFLVGLLLGGLNFAQANSVTLTSNSTLHGQDAYEYLVSLTAGQTINSATLTFNSVQLTAAGFNTFAYDIINRSDATTDITSENDQPGDFFTSHTPYSATAYNLGTKTFTINEIWNYTYTFTGTALAKLQAYALDGNFDFGIDPDCTYKIGSIVFAYSTTTTNVNSVPDQSATAILLGLTFVGLLAFRRKLCLN